MNESFTVTTYPEAQKAYGKKARWRIRKLTPRETYRLMDFSDADIDKMFAATYSETLKSGKVKVKPVPKTAHYKAAGNSIVVACLYHIFHQMFVATPPALPPSTQPTLFDQL